MYAVIYRHIFRLYRLLMVPIYLWAATGSSAHQYLLNAFQLLQPRLPQQQQHCHQSRDIRIWLSLAVSKRNLEGSLNSIYNIYVNFRLIVPSHAFDRSTLWKIQCPKWKRMFFCPATTQLLSRSIVQFISVWYRLYSNESIVFCSRNLKHTSAPPKLSSSKEEQGTKTTS